MIRKAEPRDAGTVARLMCALWPHNAPGEMLHQAEEMLRNDRVLILLADEIAFAQCGLRHDYVEGTATSPVGYLEGIYVAPEARGRGIARQLLSGCMDWARRQGCREFASDCEADNADSLAFHLAVGFAQANRIICFVREL